MELDAATSADGTTHSADICVVGAGPAGLTLADALDRAGVAVVVIESGGSGPGSEPGSAELNAGIITGDPLADLRVSRARGIGGTAALWNTVRGGVAGAKYVPLDSIDLNSRPELPGSGWPFGRRTLEPWYARAHELCGLGAPGYGGDEWSDARHSLLPFGEAGLTSTVYRWGDAERFRRVLPDALRASSRTLLIHGATVTELAAAPGGERISEARWATRGGKRGVVRAQRFVLAAGTIENTRLLLLFQRQGRPDSGSWLGRGFMEHPIDRSLTLVSRHPALSPDPGFYSPFGVGSRAGVIGRIGLSEALLREGRLWNASVRLFAVRERRIRRVARRLSRLAGGAPATTYRLLLDLEQAPHRENRVVLSSEPDPLGMPRVEVQWRWRPEDEANRGRVVATIIQELERTGAGKVEADATAPLDPDAHHHAGTTRMHQDPGLGVVDADLRVHGLENLFVTGASVFPTAGVANPTLTILALALRLAERLRTR